jgi:hypothetical protein
MLRWSVLVCGFGVLISTSLAAGRNGTAPVWSIALKANTPGIEINDEVALVGSPSLIVFGSNSEIVVLGHQPITIGHMDQQVTAYALDAATGEIRGKREWTNYGSSAVFASADGKYAVIDHGTRLYSAGLTDEVARTTKAVRCASPDGGRFAAVFRPNKAEEWASLSSESLDEQGVLVDVASPSISDDSLAGTRRTRSGSSEIVIESPNRAPVIYTPKWGTGRPQFVSNSVILVIGHRNYDAVSKEGKCIFTGTLSDDQPYVTSSRAGNRVAIVERSYRGSREELTGESVRVLDLGDGRVVWSLALTALRGQYENVSQVALSPDGTSIAVLSLGQVTLYRIAGS